MKRIAVVCGGFSGEKVISLRSASMVMNNINRDSYDPILVRIDHDGWVAEFEGADYPIDKNDFSFTTTQKISFDGVFIMIHGTPGEDGILQGYFDLLSLPYTTGGVLNMSLTFNKAVTNDYLREKGFNTAKSVVLKSNDPLNTQHVVNKLGMPCFVKPNRGGSSIATTKVINPESLESAIEKAFTACEEVIIESFIPGREVTCGVIEKDGKPFALPITEIVSLNDFFDFDAKYEGQSDEITPAQIDPKIYTQIQKISESIYSTLNSKGMIRIDYLLPEDGIYIIEVNTVPGFSEQSIIPQQAAAINISKKELITLVLQSCGL